MLAWLLLNIFPLPVLNPVRSSSKHHSSSSTSAPQIRGLGNKVRAAGSAALRGGREQRDPVGEATSIEVSPAGEQVRGGRVRGRNLHSGDKEGHANPHGGDGAICAG